MKRKVMIRIPGIGNFESWTDGELFSNNETEMILTDVNSISISSDIKEQKEDILPTYIREKIFTTIGQASMCWESIEKAGIFDSNQASVIGEDLCEFFSDEIWMKG